MQRQRRISAYKEMWLFVMFDLPSVTKKEKKAYRSFVKKLEKDGFSRFQYSVFTRHCASRESMNVHLNRIEKMIPDAGRVSVLKVTDKQYADLLNFWGYKVIKPRAAPQQLEMF